MKELKLNFFDFWSGFDKLDNHFYYWLSQKYIIIISDTPEIIFYSCFGNEYLKYDCIRIFFTGENVRPDFTGCDYAFSFDYNTNLNHYRLPLYRFPLLHNNVKLNGHKTVNQLTLRRNKEEFKQIWSKKIFFCCMLFSNPLANKRINFFKNLSKTKPIDSGGRVLNNIGYQVEDKLSFYKDYRFVISFENESYPGYTTEKILDAILADCIPIYWGNPLIGNDFNKKRFINYYDFENETELIRYIIEIENDDSKAISIISEPIFPENKIPECINDSNILNFLMSIIDHKDNKITVAKTNKRFIHLIKRKIQKVNDYIKISRQFTILFFNKIFAKI